MTYRPTPSRLIKGPVQAGYTDIWDAEGNHICDIRGWGRLQYFENGAELQDQITLWIVDAINERLKTDPI